MDVDRPIEVLIYLFLFLPALLVLLRAKLRGRAESCFYFRQWNHNPIFFLIIQIDYFIHKIGNNRIMFEALENRENQFMLYRVCLSKSYFFHSRKSSIRNQSVGFFAMTYK